MIIHECTKSGRCFARVESLITPNKMICTILDTLPDGDCPFQKPEQELTDGKRYPMNHAYDCVGNTKNINVRKKAVICDDWDRTVNRLRRLLASK